MEVYKRIVESFYIAEELRQQRISNGTQPSIVEHTTSPYFIFTANSIYVFVTYALYSYMSRRKESFSEQIRPFMLAYNCICVVLAGAVVYGFIEYLYVTNFDMTFVCNPLNQYSAVNARLASFFWLFHIQKFWEFFDTWIFLLRKSFRQVSFLHVYHHVSINIVVGLSLPYAWAGDMYLPIVLNAFVHVLLYTHYFLTGLGIRSWWAHHLTKLQLVQFLLIATQSAMAWWRGPTCGLSDWTKALLIGYMATMVILFGNFYIQKYLGSGKEQKRPAAVEGDAKAKAAKTD